MIDLYWYILEKNFGDALTPFLVEAVSGKKARYARQWNEELCAVGSILDGYVRSWRPLSRLRHAMTCWWALRSRPVSVWGTGFLGAHDTFLPIKRKFRITALRGTGSIANMRRFLGENYCDWNALPIGDPGLLFGRTLLKERPEPIYDLGLMPHGHDKKIGESIAELLREHYGDNVCLLDVEADPLETLHKLAQCKTLLASAMHGCITADGLGIPNHLLCLSHLNRGGEANWRFKFDDYYSFCGKSPDPWTLADIIHRLKTLPEDIRRSYDVPQDAVLATQERLLGAFPKDIGTSP